MLQYIRRKNTRPNALQNAMTSGQIALTRTTGLIATCALFALAACADKKPDASALNADPALSRDLALAANDSGVKPQLQDVPAVTPPAPVPEVAPAPAPVPVKRPAPAPVRRPTPAPKAPVAAPAPAPAPAAPTTGTVAAGSAMKFAANQKVCSNSTPIGERFTANLTESVSASNGMSIPAGAVGTFEVSDSRTAQASSDSTYLRVRLISVQYDGRTYPIQATVQTASTDRSRSASKTTDAKKVAGGAVIGGILGQIIGKNTKGTVIGAAAGAAAGTAAAAATANYDTCLNAGAGVTVTLDAPATIRAASAP